MRKRILVITPRLPYPPIGGDRLRILSLCEILARQHQLTLASLCSSREDMRRERRSAVFAEEYRVLQPRALSLVNTLMNVFSGQPLQNGYFYNKEFSALVQRLLPGHDLVLAHLIRAGQYVPDGVDVPAVLEMTDAISLNYQRIRRHEGKRGLRSRIFTFESQRLLPFEIEAVERFDYTSLVSSVDRSWLVEHGAPEGKIGVHTLALDLEKYRFNPEPSGSDIVFIGNIDTVQNTDACLAFAEQVLPLCRERRDVRFLIIGKCSNRLAARLNRIEGVHATGAVDSIESFLSNAFCGVCFLRIGAGIQTKILEYMAFGLPAVVNSRAHEGLSAQSGRDLLVKDDPREFAAAIIELLESDDERRRLATAGRTYVETSHTYKAIGEPFLEILNSLMANSRRKP